MCGEKTTLYLDPDVKISAKIKVLKINQKQQSGEKESLSSIVNELLKKWLQE